MPLTVAHVTAAHTGMALFRILRNGRESYVMKSCYPILQDGGANWSKVGSPIFGVLGADLVRDFGRTNGFALEKTIYPTCQYGVVLCNCI